MWRDKSAKKDYSNRENCQEGSRQERYIDGWTSNMTRNIGEDWKETGDDGRARNQ